MCSIIPIKLFVCLMKREYNQKIYIEVGGGEDVDFSFFMYRVNVSVVLFLFLMWFCRVLFVC